MIVRPTTEPTDPKWLCHNRWLINNGGRGRWLVFLWGKSATNNRLNPKQREEVRCRIPCFQAFRFAFAGQIEALRKFNIGRHTGETVSLLLKITKNHRAITPSCEKPEKTCVRVPYPHQISGTAIGQGLKKYRLDHAEDGRRRSNTQRERQDDNCCETRILDQNAQGISKVLRH